MVRLGQQRQEAKAGRARRGQQGAASGRTTKMMGLSLWDGIKDPRVSSRKLILSNKIPQKAKKGAYCKYLDL